MDRLQFSVASHTDRRLQRQRYGWGRGAVRPGVLGGIGNLGTRGRQSNPGRPGCRRSGRPVGPVCRGLELGQPGGREEGTGPGRVPGRVHAGQCPGHARPPARGPVAGLPGCPQTGDHLRGRLAQARRPRRAGLPPVGATRGQQRSNGVWLTEYAEPAAGRLPEMLRGPARAGAGQGWPNPASRCRPSSRPRGCSTGR
jgi:hypothetical protein